MVGTLCAANPAISSAWLSLLQRRRQILDQIIRMLEPGREANESFAEPERGAHLRLQALMRRGGRMRHETLGIAEIVRDFCELQLVEHAECCGLPAFHLETDQRRATAHLLLHQSRLR